MAQKTVLGDEKKKTNTGLHINDGTVNRHNKEETMRLVEEHKAQQKTQSAPATTTPKTTEPEKPKGQPHANFQDLNSSIATILAKKDKQDTVESINKKNEEREAKIKENPDYEYDLYQFANDKGDVMSGKDFKEKSDEWQANYDNIQNSFSELEYQYKKDKDTQKYVDGYNSLLNQAKLLDADAEYLNSFSAQYNNAVTDEYDANKERMQQIVQETAYIKKYGGDLQTLEALNNEYVALKSRNEELQTLYDDVTSLKESDYYNWLQENGDEKTIQEYESLIASRELNPVSNAIKGIGSTILTTPLYAVLGCADIAFDLLGETAGAVMGSVAESLNKNGFIDDESFNKISDVAKEFQAFEYDNENNFSQQLREYRARIDNEVRYGRSDLETVAVSTINSAIENYVRYATLNKYGTYLMAMTKFADSYYECKQKGYTDQISLLNSSIKAYITWQTENMGTERYFEMVGSMAGERINNLFFSLLAQNLVDLVPQEGFEEGAEYFLDYSADMLAYWLSTPEDPSTLVEPPEFKIGDLLKGSMMAMASSALTASAGAVSANTQINSMVPVIKTAQQYEEFSAELKELETIVSYEPNIKKQLELKRFIDVCKSRIDDYEKNSPTAGKIVFESEIPQMPTQEQAEYTYKEGMMPTAMTMSDEQVKTDSEIQEFNSYIKDLTQNVLYNRGINMNYKQYLGLTDEARKIVNRTSETFNNLNDNKVLLRFDTDAEKGASVKALGNGMVMMTINPNSETAIADLFEHEIIHLVAQTGVWQELLDRSDLGQGRRKETNKQRLRNAGYDESVIEEELVAYFHQGKYDIDTFLNVLGMADKSALRRLDNAITDFINRFGKQSDADTLARKIANAYKSVMANPSLTTQGAMANNDANGLQAKDRKNMRSVQDIDPGYNDKGESGRTGREIEGQEEYDRLFDGFINQLLQKRSDAYARNVELTAEDAERLGKDFIPLRNGVLGLKKSTINNLIKEYKDQNAYIAFIDPIQHPYLTGQGYDGRGSNELFLQGSWFSPDIREDLDLQSISDNMNFKETKESDGEGYFLVIYNDDGKYRNFGHQGRHRSISMVTNGIFKVPVVIENDGEENLANKDIQVYADSSGFDGSRYENRSTIIEDLIPLDQEHKQELIDVFYKGEDIDYRLNKDLEVDDKGNVMTTGMSMYLENSIGDRVDPNDPASPHMQWLHGTENAVFTEFDNTKERVIGNDDYVNESKAIYLTASPKTASSYSGTEKVVDPYNIQGKPKTLEELKNVLEENDVKLVIGKNDHFGEEQKYAFFFGDGLEALSGVGADMGEYYDWESALEDFYIDKKTGEAYTSNYAFHSNDVDFDDEELFEEVKGFGYPYKNDQDIIEYAWDVFLPNKGNYELYAKSENPLIVDVKGERWDNLPSLGTVVVREADDPNNFMPEYNNFQTVDDINNYFKNVELMGRLFEIGDDLEQALIEQGHDPFDAQDIVNIVSRSGKYKYAYAHYWIWDQPGKSKAKNRIEWKHDLRLFENLNQVKDSPYVPLPQPKTKIEHELNTTRDYEQYALDNGYDSIRYRNIIDPGKYGGGEKTEVLVVFDPNQVKSIYNQNPTMSRDMRENKDIDLNGLESKLKKALPGIEVNDSTRKLLDSVEESIVFSGEVTSQMRELLAQQLYDSRKYEIQGEAEVSKKEINSWLRKNPLKWASVKGDTRQGLIDFQKEHPGFRFLKEGSKNWDVVMNEFNEFFPGAIDPESINTAVDFINAVQDYRNAMEEAGKSTLVDPQDEDTFYPAFEKAIDEFIAQNQPKVKPKQMTQRQMEAIEHNREAFRKSVKDWVMNYDVMREKFNIFDKKSFDDAIADVYVVGEVTDQTWQELKDDIIKNDFNGELTGSRADRYIEQFIDEAVDYYILETEYNVNQKYRDTIAKTANIINQAQNGLYEEDYDRSETALQIDQMAKEARNLDYDAINEMVQYVVDHVENKKNVFYNRDLKEYHDILAGGKDYLRQKMFELVEEPIRDAQAEELKILQKYKTELENLQKEVGIKMYSEEDEAVGWIIEGKKQNGEGYNLSDLKKDFPKKWKDIMKIVDYYTKTVEGWYNEEIAEAERIYGDIEYRNQVKTAKLENQLESARTILFKRQQDLKKNKNAKTQAGYSKAKKNFETAERRYKAQLKKNEEHVDTRRQFTPYRKNYFHHTDEVHFGPNARAFFEMVKNGPERRNNIPSELAGMTEYTEPKTTIQSYRWKQGSKNYSSSGFASLQHRMREHANAMAFDPAITYLRTVESTFRELDADNNANNYLTWLTKYINNLAGKSNDLDRVIRDATPDDVMFWVKTLNDRAKKNAVYGNISSALVQTGNFPVGVGLAVKNGGKDAVKDLIKGTAQYLMDSRSDNPIKNASTFLNMRYYDIDLKDDRFLTSSLDKFGDFMMTVLDKATAEEMWYMFYAQGERMGKENPILYADQMVDRATQGRRPEDMPLSQQSEIIKLVAPFQAEVNNQWQVMKDMAKGSIKGDNKMANIAGLVSMAITSALMSAGFKKILNRDPLFNPIGALIDVLGSKDVTEDKIVGRLLGEVLGAVPGAQYIPSLLGLNEAEAEALFGDSDPSRYGTGNIGISAIAKLLSAETPEARNKALEEVLFMYGPNGYGKQLLRTYRAGQDFGYAPKYVNGEWRMDPIHYTQSGGIAFANDPKDVFDFLKSIIGGQYSTKAGQEYVDSGFEKMGESSVKDSNGNTIRGSKAMMVRKEMEELGIYDEIVEQIRKGQMSAQKAGLTDAVIKLSQEEFDQKYENLMVQAKGIHNAIAKEYGWDKEQKDSLIDAINIEADYKNGRKVNDSEALKTRKAMEEAGIYEQVLDYIEKNDMDPTSVGLGKRVIGYDEDEFLKAYASKIGE